MHLYISKQWYSWSIYILEARGKGGPRRGSIFDVMRPRGYDNKDIDLGHIELEDTTTASPTNTIDTLQAPRNNERKSSRPRSDSIITPGLIKKLKKNKKRIIAKGLISKI